ncbi:FtsX-like permease family protein [Mollicutes bacterium LVI A0039]|nr:FtsX-like permease family protein [Mollicutes bacterium LVI A0039]
MITKYKNLYKLSSDFIKENKKRAFLSVISVTIGLTGILIVLIISSSISNNLKAETSEIKKLELTAINEAAATIAPEDEQLISDYDLSFLNSQYPEINITRSAPLPQVNVGGKSYTVSFADQIKITEGRDFTNSTGRDVILHKDLIGEDGSLDYKIGDKIAINDIYYTIVGTTEDITSNFYMPMYLDDLFKQDSSANNLEVSMPTKMYKPELMDEIVDQINELSQNPMYTYMYFDMEEILSMLVNIISTVAVVFGSIILLVSLIGIINMLYVSVSERQSEIAILRSQGLQKSDISMMFLFEALIIICIATIISFIFAFIISILILNFQDIELYISPLYLVSIALFVILVTMITGVAPARKAASINISEILI